MRRLRPGRQEKHQLRLLQNQQVGGRNQGLGKGDKGGGRGGGGVKNEKVSLKACTVALSL